jgi:hypothetical protein
MEPAARLFPVSSTVEQYIANKKRKSIGYLNLPEESLLGKPSLSVSMQLDRLGKRKANEEIATPVP